MYHVLIRFGTEGIPWPWWFGYGPTCWAAEVARPAGFVGAEKKAVIHAMLTYMSIAILVPEDLILGCYCLEIALEKHFGCMLEEDVEPINHQDDVIVIGGREGVQIA
jgi:predicted transcriptional regulator